MNRRKQYGSGHMEEEEENLEEHMDLHHDYMMENHPLLTSPGESSNSNTSERCPLYSWDSTQEHQEIPQDDQVKNINIKVEVKEEAEDMYEGYDTLGMEEGMPPEISPDGPSHKNALERYSCPAYSCDSTQDHQEMLQDDKNGNLIYIKVEVKEEAEEMYVTSDDPCKEEESSPENDTDGQHSGNKTGTLLPISPVENVEANDTTSITSEENHITPYFSSAPHSADLSSGPSTPWRSFSDYSTFVAHHPDPRIATFSRSEHSEDFTQNEDLTSHQRSYTEEKPYSCAECGKGFGRKENLILHQRSHTGVKPFPCTECGRRFTRKDILILHERTHTGVKPFSCPECGKSFSRKETLTTHQRSHTGEKPYSCSECKKCFSQRETLVLHQRIHTGMKPYSCLECGKSFTQRAHLLSHERNHTGEKPFSCSLCGKSFIQRVHLISHERTHSGVKPFSCADCGKSFAERSNLAKHQRTHTGEKPFSCSECGKSFSEKSYLITHEKVHTGEKPYSCSECGKRFSKKTYLLSHLRSHKLQVSVTGSGI